MKKSILIQSPSIWYLAILAIFLLVLDSSGNIGIIRNPIASFLQPIYFSGEDFSKQVLVITDGLRKIDKTSLVIDGLKTKVNQLESKVSDYDILTEKYDSLLLHSKTANKKYEYIQASGHILRNNGQLVLDIGREDNVNINDVVVLGNVYIGQIISVDANSSLVRTADDFGSNIEVIIQKAKKSNSENNPVRAVAIGNKNEITIENIASSSGISNGDLVIVDDKDIGGYLILGKISGISQDKAASILTAKVVGEVDVLLAKFVYVRK